MCRRIARTDGTAVRRYSVRGTWTGWPAARGRHGDDPLFDLIRAGPSLRSGRQRMSGPIYQFTYVIRGTAVPSVRAPSPCIVTASHARSRYVSTAYQVLQCARPRDDPSYTIAAKSIHAAMARPIPTFIAAATTRPINAPVATRVAPAA